MAHVINGNEDCRTYHDKCLLHKFEKTSILWFVVMRIFNMPHISMHITFMTCVPCLVLVTMLVVAVLKVFPSQNRNFQIPLLLLVGVIIGDLFIGPESDHWLCLSVTPSLPITHSLTHSCLVNLMALYDPNCLMMSSDHWECLSVTNSLTPV